MTSYFDRKVHKATFLFILYRRKREERGGREHSFEERSTLR